MKVIRVGILGYGNLGRGVELACRKASDMKLVAVFTRRDPSSLTLESDDAPVYSVDELLEYRDSIDVLIICGGSATDLPVQTPQWVEYFNVVDSFDTHANIPEHYAKVEVVAKASGKVGLISCGWDPGMFSIARLYANAILPEGKDYTFWGRGVSQGHSDAIRRIEGVLDARQYTIPVESALDRVRAGENPELTTREKHVRECFVVAEEGANKVRIAEQIVTMPNYFDQYETTVHFVSMEELKRDHAGLPHGGRVIRSGSTGDGASSHVIEYSLKLDSNPEFTGSVLVASARAAFRLNVQGESGAYTLFDIAPVLLSERSAADLRASML